jgi:predicted nucleic acid-binding protein
MKDKTCFFDTNLLVYLYSSDETNKKQLITDLVNSLKSPHISTQVISEISNVLSRKKLFTAKQIELVLLEIEAAFTINLVSTHDIHLALRLFDIYKYSFFDCLILSSALKVQCSVLFSEDFQHEQMIDQKLQIINPFYKLP